MMEAVIFDCDGVLVDSEVLAIDAELTTLSEIGLTYETGDFKARFMGLSDKAFFAALDDDHRARLGTGLPEGFRDICKARYHASWDRLAEVPGAAAVISAITLPVAVASSSTESALDRKLRKTGLWSLFAPHIYSADHVTHAKPAPDLFLYAAEALKVKPDACLVLEDSANGVLAARAAGMTVWGFLGGGHMDEASGRRLMAAGAQRLVRDWREAGRELGVSI